jgi:hypothetical protein
VSVCIDCFVDAQLTRESGYLNNLPEPIVPLDLYERFRDPLRGHVVAAVGDLTAPPDVGEWDLDHAISTYQRLITELPPLNRQLLLYILDLLAVFASKSDENRMNSANLSAIFQPGLLSHPAHDMAPEEYHLSQNVLIFLIENQDHFLIGMSGTAADEKTVQEVQNGGTPPPSAPSTPGSGPSRSKTIVGRSSSNASAGANSVRKFGDIRRNVSVSSKHSRQSNGAPSPASPAYGAALTQTPSGGVHRSNTVPSKRSPALSNRMQKTSGSPSPNAAALSPSAVAAPRGASPASAVVQAAREESPAPSASTSTAMGTSSLAPASSAITAQRSHERLLSDSEGKADVAQPKERSASNLFQRSPTGDSEKRAPNKLRKKRIPGSSNPSAQSSTNSLHGPGSVSHSPLSPPVLPSTTVTEHPLESIPSGTPLFSHTDATLTALNDGQFGNLDGAYIENPANLHAHAQDRPNSSDGTLKPSISPSGSIRSHTTNEQSDFEHVDDPSAAAEQSEKRRRWRLSRRKESHGSQGMLGADLSSPKKAIGSNSGADGSSSSVQSAIRPRKSFTGDAVPAASEVSKPHTTHHQYSSSESGTNLGSKEDKKNPIDWIKSKFRGDKDETRDVEKESAKSSTHDVSTSLSAPSIPVRGKSIEIKREEPEKIDKPTTEEVPAPVELPASTTTTQQ